MSIKSQFLIKLYFFLVNGLVVQELFRILDLLIIDKPKNLKMNYQTKQKKKDWKLFVSSQNSNLIEKMGHLNWMLSIKDKSINGLINRNMELESDLKSQQHIINKLQNKIDDMRNQIAELSYELSQNC